MKDKKNNHDFYKGIFFGLGIIAIVIFAFFLGLKLGRKEFYYRYPPMFHPFFGEKRKAFIPPRFRGHGLVGVLDSIGKNSFVVENRWGELITVLVDKNTKYYFDSKRGKFSDLKKGQNVVVVGKPKENEVAILAKIIRILK